MSIPEWGTVKKYIQDQIRSEQRALEGCPLDEVLLHRGRLSAFKAVLQLAEERPVDDGSVASLYPQAPL